MSTSVKDMTDEALWLRIKQIGSKLFNLCQAECGKHGHTNTCNKHFAAFQALTNEDARRFKLAPVEPPRRQLKRQYYENLRRAM